MAGIIISYRRDDSGDAAVRLADELADLLGADQVVPDVEIPIDSDFSDLLHRAVAASEGLLVVIGPHWATPLDGRHAPRLFEPTDGVRTLIEAAFAQGKPVIPILLGGAQMPAAEGLPQSIARLARLQAADLGGDRWDTGLEDLADHLHLLCPAMAEKRSAAPARAESPADVFGELADRLAGEAVPRRRPRIQPPTLPPTTLQRLLAVARRALTWLLWSALVLGLVYAGLRLFGGQPVLRGLDIFEAWLQAVWGHPRG